MIDLAFKESCKDRIIEIIDARIPLKKTSSVWKGLCPWHPDRKPSLSVSPVKRLWRCWVCNVGGDAISFVQKFHDVDFKEALRILGAPVDNKSYKVAPVLHALKEIDKDATDLLSLLTSREKRNTLIFQAVGRQFVKTPPLQIPARWYLREQICDQVFEEIDRERVKIEAIRQKHRKGVLV